MRISKPAGAPTPDLPAAPNRVNKTGESTYDYAYVGLVKNHDASEAVGKRPIDVEMKARMAACVALQSEKMSIDDIAATLQLSRHQVQFALSRARATMSREQAFTDAVERMDRDIVPLAVDRLHEKVHEGKRWAIQDVLHGRRVLQKQAPKDGGGGQGGGGGYSGPAVVINIVPNEKRPDVMLGTVIGQAKFDEHEPPVAALTIGLPVKVVDVEESEA